LGEKAVRVFMDTGKAVRVERKNEIGRIILSSPETLNVLGTPALSALEAALADLGGDRRIKVLIITGIKHFCAGADIREMKDKNQEEAESFARLGHRICDTIEGVEKPVIAAICGYCLGGGCEIALACDIRLAAEDSKFGQPEVNLGLIPGFGGTQRLTRLVGMGRAKELILTGRIISAGEALSMGLVNSVAGNDELLHEADETAEALAQKGPLALGAAKKLINGSLDITRGLETEIDFFSKCFTTEDHREGINAFLDKRRPRFKGK
jgi:enoyl-CoA hydratase